MSVDPHFLKFFAGQWQDLLAECVIPGMAGASWDRKAAWLFWELTSDSTPYDVFGYAVDPVRREPQPSGPAPWNDPEAIGNPYVGGMTPSAPVIEGTARRVPVGSEEPVNPVDDADCVPDPNGISLTFDSARW